MNSKFFYAIGGVLPHHLPRQLKELYWAALLQNLALAMLLLFEPIYLWQKGYGLTEILIFFLAVYVLYVAIMPIGANYATQHGFEHSIAVSTAVQVAYYVCLFLVASSPWFLIPAAVLYALQKALYWPAYHADFAYYADQVEEGREVSALQVALLGVYVLGPLLAGWLLTVGSWAWLFGIGSAILLVSNWPLLKTAETFLPRDFPYQDTYRRLFSRENRRRLLGYLGFGEELIVLVLWPIAISLIVVEYFEIGAVVAASTLLTALATLYVGKLTDESNKHAVLRFSTVLYSLGWLVRLVAVTPFAVFLTDAWSRLTKNVVSVPLTTITYERAKTHLVMDTVVFFEMSLAVGKVLAIVLLLVGLTFVHSLAAAWQMSWVVAAAMTLLYGLL